MTALAFGQDVKPAIPMGVGVVSFGGGFFGGFAWSLTKFRICSLEIRTNARQTYSIWTEPENAKRLNDLVDYR